MKPGAELRVAAGCVVAALLTGACAPRAPLPDAVTESVALASDWTQRRAQLQADVAFSVAGRVAVAAGEQGFSAGLRWLQRDERGEIHLDGPLGIGALAIATDGDALRVATGRGARLEGAAARAEIERQLGFALPLDALRYWVRGVPSPLSTAIETTAADAPRLQQLQQDGWTIDFTEYQPDPFAHRPRRLVAQNGVARVRLVLERWSAAPP